jgi:phytoene/squalene synthetase
MLSLFHQTSFACSRIVTEAYSTSFSLGIKTLHSRFRNPVYAIYGFVRYADEIVDTFHELDKEKLLAGFREATFEAIKQQISLNPILHAFQRVVHQYRIDPGLVDDFLDSMAMDLGQTRYEPDLYRAYIYGSAEAVGLMCLKVFCEGNHQLYQTLRLPAQRLGAAFQKVNFLRDMQIDYQERGRVYFPGVDFTNFSQQDKWCIEESIQQDFELAYQGIRKLPEGARQGVYLAYTYYLHLFQKITRITASQVKQQRIRLPNNQKALLLAASYVRHRINWL